MDPVVLAAIAAVLVPILTGLLAEGFSRQRDQRRAVERLERRIARLEQVLAGLNKTVVEEINGVSSTLRSDFEHLRTHEVGPAKEGISRLQASSKSLEDSLRAGLAQLDKRTDQLGASTHEELNRHMDLNKQLFRYYAELAQSQHERILEIERHLRRID